MSKKFNKFVEYVTEYVRPSPEPPYGFWISPDGAVTEVRRFGHSAVAREILENDPKLRVAFLDSSVRKPCWILTRGYLRCAVEADELHIDRFKSFGCISRKAKSAYDFLCDQYNLLPMVHDITASDFD